MDKKIKQRLGDGKINTSFEMIENLEEKLWESNPMEALRHERIETRKKLKVGTIYIVHDYSFYFFVFSMVIVFWCIAGRIKGSD
jgi:hypothetical protein